MNKGRPNTQRKINGERVRDLMKKKHIRFDTLSRYTGFDRSYITVSVKYEMMSAAMLEAVAKYFNVSESELLA